MTVPKRYVPLTVSVPAGTAIANPTKTNPALGDVWLYQVQVRIPSGHAGFTGLGIQDNGVSLVPWSPNTSWVVGDNDYFVFDVNTETDTGLAVLTYNTDVLVHGFYLRFVCAPISAVAPPPTTQIVAVS